MQSQAEMSWPDLGLVPRVSNNVEPTGWCAAPTLVVVVKSGYVLEYLSIRWYSPAPNMIRQ